MSICKKKEVKEMRYTNKPNGFREKSVLRKRIIPDIVGFKELENIIENNAVLRNKVDDISSDNNPKLE